MRIKRTHFNLIILVAASVIGAAFGFVQQPLAQWSNQFESVDSFTIYTIGMVGWLVFVVWQVLGLQFSALRWQGLMPHSIALAVLLLFCGFAIVGTVANYYLVIEKEGLIQLSMFELVSGAMLMSGAHSLVLIVLPMIITRTSLMFSRKRAA